MSRATPMALSDVRSNRVLRDEAKHSCDIDRVVRRCDCEPSEIDEYNCDSNYMSRCSEINERANGMNIIATMSVANCRYNMNGMSERVDNEYKKMKNSVNYSS